MKYPHNHLGYPQRPKTRFRVGNDSTGKRTGTGFHEVWIEGEDPDSAEFVDIRYLCRTR